MILDKTGLLKDEYLRSEYFNYGSGWFWFYFLMPVLMTYITIRWIPLLLKKSYKREKDDDFDMQDIKFRHNKKIESLKTQIEEKKIANLEKAEQRVEKEKQVESLETEEWRKEYIAFKRSRYFDEFRYIVEAIYEHKGQLNDDWNSNGHYYEFEVPTTVLTFAHTSNLVQLDKDRESIQLTDKGKFFVRQFALGADGATA